MKPITRTRNSSRILRRASVIAAMALALVIQVPSAQAHPLGNFTTNTALQLTVSPNDVRGLYVVDFAEIPALQIRQKLGFATTAVPAEVINTWGGEQCASISKRVELATNQGRRAWDRAASSAAFLPGEAGLSTLRLECRWRVAVDSVKSLRVEDSNFTDRQGWHEITVNAAGVALNSELPAVSPTDLLRSYPADTLGVARNVRSARIDVIASTGRSAATGGESVRGSSAVAAQGRGNDGLTNRFQSLVARENLSPLFAFGAALLAMVLGGFHALAPGHGKSLMAAYVVGQNGGRRRELATIGVTVAVTHTVGVVVLGALALASSSFSPERTFTWAGVGSGALVVMVGLGLLRDRLRTYRSGRPRRASRSNRHHDHAHPHHDHAHHDHAHHDHAHHDHAHHDHAHHDHAHDHPHPHPNGLTRRVPLWRARRLDAARNDPNFVVTQHAHGGVSHTHVLPAPGAKVSRRQLVSMGFAGGLVPSPSALVVLLGAIALQRLWFGVVLVVAYGIGLALTLVGAGLALVYFETKLTSWSLGGGRASVLAPVLNALPIASAFALIGGGALLITRALTAV